MKTIAFGFGKVLEKFENRNVIAEFDCGFYLANSLSQVPDTHGSMGKGGAPCGRKKAGIRLFSIPC
jgi:hypothetical protein